MECKKCGRVGLAQGDFYTYSSGKQMRHCKECHKAMVAENRPTPTGLRRRKTRVRKPLVFQTECKKCGRENLTENDFYVTSKGTPMLYCKECHKAAVKARGSKSIVADIELKRRRAREQQRRKYWSDPQKARAIGREKYRRKKERKEAEKEKIVST